MIPYLSDFLAKVLSKSTFGTINTANKVLSEINDGSLIEFSAPTRNVILTTVEDRLTHHEVIEHILKFSTNLYTGYYMQAVALLNNVNNVSVRETLDRLNTNRNLRENIKDQFNRAGQSAGVPYIVLESYLDYPQFSTRIPRNVAMEAYVPNSILEAKPEHTPPARSSMEAQESARNVASDAPNLAQGKVFEVTIENNGKSARIPVTVLLSPIVCNRSMFTAMYSEANQNNTMVARFRRWMDGELDTISDMIFVNDIIKDKAKLIKQDKNKIVEQLERKRRNNMASAVVTSKTSLATASTITVFTKETAGAIELSVGGRLDNPKIRDYIFERSGLIMMVIVDEMYESVTIYHRGQDHKMELTFNECKFASKGSGPNVMEVLRAFQSGQTPNI